MLLVDKMAHQNLPGYQPRKFIDTGYVNDLSFQQVDVSSCNCCSNGVTAELLKCLLQYCSMIRYAFFLDIITFYRLKLINHHA